MIYQRFMMSKSLVLYLLNGKFSAFSWTLLLELWPSSIVWIFQNPLGQLFIRFLSITKTNLVYLSFYDAPQFSSVYLLKWQVYSLHWNLRNSPLSPYVQFSMTYFMGMVFSYLMHYKETKEKKTILRSALYRFAVKDILSFFCTCE